MLALTFRPVSWSFGGKRGWRYKKQLGLNRQKRYFFLRMLCRFKNHSSEVKITEDQFFHFVWDNSTAATLCKENTSCCRTTSSREHFG